MATDIERLEVLIEANTRSYTVAMEKLLANTQRASTGSIIALARLEKTIVAVGASMFTAFAGPAMAIFAAAAIPRAIIDITDRMKELEEQADKIGVTTTALQELRVVAKQAGVDAEALGTGMSFFGKMLSQAAAGAGNLEPILKANGVALRDAQGKMIPVLEQLKRFADLVKNATSEQDRLNLVAQAFGKSSTDLVNVFRDGGAALDRYMQKAKDTGQVIDENLVKKGAEFAKAWETASNRMWTAVETGVLNSINALDKLGKWYDDHRNDNLGGLIQSITPKGGFGAMPPVLPQGDPAATARSAAMEAATAKLRADLFEIQHAKPTVVPNTGDIAKTEALQKKYAELADTIAVETRNLTLSRREQEMANAVTRLGVDATQQQKDGIAALAGALYDAKVNQEALNQAAEFFGQTAYDALDGLLLKGRSFNDVLKEMIIRLAEAVFQASLLGQGPLAGLFGTAPTGNLGIGGLLGGVAKAIFGGFRAAGGDVSPGRGYMVGERGPEWFVPRSAGSIMPNHGLGGSSRLELFIHSTTTPLLDQRIDVRAAGVSVRVFKEGSKQQQRQGELAA